MADFRPFSPCWGDISFTEAPQRLHGATQGRYFFHAPPAWQTPEEPSAPQDAAPGRGAGRSRQNQASEKSHAIRLEEVSTTSENVAIPTI